MKTTPVKYPILRAYLLLFSFLLYAQSVPYDTMGINTATMHAQLTNVGSLDWRPFNKPGIYWLGYNGSVWERSVEFDHGLWLSGYQQDSLITTASCWDLEYSQGPIINGEAAMIAAPEDSTDYRIYHIDNASGPGDPDYDQWPIQWGAPHADDGSPTVIGQQTTFMIYNDAHPSPDLQGWPSSPANPIEIHETVWDYGTADSLSNVIFFRYHIYNRSSDDWQNFILGLWTDIDLAVAGSNRGGYNETGKYMFMYNPINNIAGLIPTACAYVLLQGPMVPSPGNTAHFFGKTVAGAENLPPTAGWCIKDESDTFGQLGSYPADATEQRYIMEGRMPDGSPIINPLTGDTTTFTYNGNPITNEGWNWLMGGGGGAGFLTSSGPFDFLAGDSNEAIFALVAIADTTFESALTRLENQVVWLRSWWDNNWTVNIEANRPLPYQYTLYQNYPNPFNPTTTIRYKLPRRSAVQLIIYDIVGKEVTTLVSGTQEAGHQSVVWDATGLSSGVYFYQLRTSNFVQTNKMILLK